MTASEPNLWSWPLTKAKKLHFCGCDVCDQDIHPGELYVTTTIFPGYGYYEGDRPKTWRACRFCQHAFDEATGILKRGDCVWDVDEHPSYWLAVYVEDLLSRFGVFEEVRGSDPDPRILLETRQAVAGWMR